MYFEGTIDMTKCMIIGQMSEDTGLLEKLLADYGFEITSADNTNMALAKCDKEMPDVIVLPDEAGSMDAMAFLKHLRNGARGHQPKVIFCAERADSERIGQAIWQGASDYMVKPYDAEILDNKLMQAGVV